MDYKKHYEMLIDRAKNRSILHTEYNERHHIIPRCLGGSEEKENLVNLFPEEHLVAHLLLNKIYPDNNGLLYAIIRMTNYRKISNKKYAWVRKKFSEYCSKNNPMKKMENRLSLSKRQTENNVATRPEVREKMSAAKKEYYKNNPGPFSGKKASLETRQKQSEQASKRTGKNACRKKKYNLISPEGVIYYCEGELMKIIKELNLSHTPLRTYMGAVVPVEHRKQYNTVLRNNTTGWMLKKL